MRSIALATILLLTGCATLPSGLYQNHVTERQFNHRYDDVWHTIVNSLVSNINTIKIADYHAGLIVTDPQVSNKTFPGTVRCGRDLTAFPLGYTATITYILRDLDNGRTNVRIQLNFKATRQSLIDRKVRLYPCNSTGVREHDILNEIEKQL